MSDLPKDTDPEYLRRHQYGDPRKLSARVQLHERFSTAAVAFHEWLFDQLGFTAGDQVLELGCGTAAMWRRNAERVAPGWRLVLTDLSPGMLAATRKAVAELPVQPRFAAADAQAIPFAGETFDAVVANHMLYHVADRPRAFAEIRRVLKPGGRLIAATNGSTHLRELRDLMSRFELQSLFAASSSARHFGLQNGPEQLKDWFHDIRVTRHDDSLRVTDAQALLEHVRSTLIDPDLAGERLAALEEYLERRIAQEGAFHVTKASGVVTAHKA